MIVEHVTDLELPHLLHEELEERLIHPLVHVYALRGDARLAGIGEAADRAAGRRPREIRIGLDDHRRIAAQLEQHALAAGLRANRPTGFRAARERDEPDARVLDQNLRDLDVARRDVDAALRITRAPDEIAETQGGERILRWRLQGDGGTTRHRGRDFVSRKQDREVERRDRRDRRQGEAARDRDPALAGRDGVGRQHFAANARRFFSGIPKHEDRSIELGARLGDRLAGFQRQCTGQLALRPLQAIGDFAQRSRALVCRKLPAGARCRDVRVERRPDLLRTR